MYSCRQVSKLKNESFHRALTLKERIGLHVHYFMCKGCKEVSKQLEFIHKMAQRFMADHMRNLEYNAKLPEPARHRIHQAINNDTENKD